MRGALNRLIDKGIPEDRVNGADETGGRFAYYLYPTLGLIPDIRYTSPIRTRKKGPRNTNPRAGDHPMALKSPAVTEKKGRNTPAKQRTPLHPAAAREVMVNPPEIGTSPAHSAAFDPRLFLGACPSNAKSAVMATSTCGSRNWKSQHMAT